MAIIVILWRSFQVNALSQTGVATVRIRGHESIQYFPTTLTSTWKSWTYDYQTCTAVDDTRDGGWVNPTSFDQLFLPADLPIPRGQLGLGVGLHNGVLRYVMPSALMFLETPGKLWRNRGLASLPRAHAFLDLYAPFSPPIEELRLCAFGQMAPDVRFLEDINGAAAWQDACSAADGSGLLQPMAYTELGITDAYQALEAFVADLPPNHELRDGFHFVDVPVKQEGKPVALRVPPYKLKCYLTNVEDPRRLLEVETAEEVDILCAAELDVMVTEVSAGGESEFLPEVYQDLYEAGVAFL